MAAPPYVHCLFPFLFKKAVLKLEGILIFVVTFNTGRSKDAHVGCTIFAENLSKTFTYMLKMCTITADK